MNPTKKFGPDDIGHLTMETLEDFELLLSEKERVSPGEVRAISNVPASAFTERVRKLWGKGLLVRHGEKPNTSYSLPEDFKERKAALVVKQVKVSAKKAVVQDKPLVRVKPEALAERGLTPDGDLPKVNGLPHRPSTELQTHVACIIEALESLQVHVNAALPLLLDMERDFERYKKVKEVLLGLKKASDIVL